MRVAAATGNGVNEQWETGCRGIPAELYRRIEAVIAISVARLLDSLLADDGVRVE